MPGDRHFVHHPNPAISAIAVDMLTEQYTLSRIWGKHGAFVETEEMKLKDIVPDTVLKFKSDKIKVMQKEKPLKKRAASLSLNMQPMFAGMQILSSRG